MIYYSIGRDVWERWERHLCTFRPLGPRPSIDRQSLRHIQSIRSENPTENSNKEICGEALIDNTQDMPA